ncbi:MULTISPECIES: TrfB-related DNA-binding protein [Burkholderia]|uniref:TrfB-related DNA-binding protein n=1 Tax=Burkholderia TaxID=32008 RepID=UPI000BF3B804|nr:MULTISPECIES: TrfB-related DNA-binding protein [unclassified Burkholderia]PFH12764.1 TrfB transcriptional repressor [Burkholderia sp. JKS000303]RQZ31655.1 hypothetical protein DIE14_01720 [Burkholderia sp. Bp9017]RQZ37786.1 hypothetical protein DIE13_01710 [Burkholderia sp. Bp9016]
MLNHENQSTIRLSEEQFAQAIAKSPRMVEKTRAIAHALLVEGRPPADLAAKYDLSLARLSQIGTKVYNDYLADVQYPPDWVKAEVIAPSDMLEEFRAQVESRRLEYFANPPAPAARKRRPKKVG